MAASVLLTPPSVTTLEKSIVKLETTYQGYVQVPLEDGSTQWVPAVGGGTCTGWFASEEGHIVTAGHCVDLAEGRSMLLMDVVVNQLQQPELLEAANQTWVVEGEAQGSDIARTVHVSQPAQPEGAVVTDPTLVQVLDYQPLTEGDLALLKLDGLTSPAPALPIADEAPEIGDPVKSIGYAGSVSMVTDLTRDRPSFKDGTVSSVRVNIFGRSGTEISAGISGGMSGGPTVGPQGEVLGVNSYGPAGENQPFNFITGTEALEDYLQSHGIETVEALAEPDRSNGSIPTGLLVGGGIGLVVLLAGIAALLLMRRKKPQTAPAVQQQSGSDTTDRMPAQYGDEPTGTYCQSCGNRNSTEARFCGGCGKSVTN